ncbi:MAG: phytase, partial [Chloroflexota bacterium]
FMNGEENENGRAWATIATGPNAGQMWELPPMGRGPWENVVASPHSKDKTIVVVLDDGSVNTEPKAESGPCQLFIYIGTKQETGSEIERAGLTNGKLYGVRLPKTTEESNDFGLGDAATGYVASSRFELVELGTAGDVTGMAQVDIEKDAIAKNVLRMMRIEDGAWDPRIANRGSLYFVTTASITTNSRLWNLKFDDFDAPEKGGTLTALLKGSEGQRMLDNLCIDAQGRILLQEDPGNAPRIARVWLYGIDSKAFVEVAYHNPVFFEPLFNTPQFLTADEESSGIVDASSVLGDGWFLAVVQAHRSIATTEPELVEDGQLLAIYVAPEIGRK